LQVIASEVFERQKGIVQTANLACDLKKLLVPAAKAVGGMKIRRA